MWKGLSKPIARRPSAGVCTTLKQGTNDECVDDTVEISSSNTASIVHSHSQVSTPTVGRRVNYTGVRLDVDEMVEAIQMASECQLNSAPTIKLRGESDSKQKLSSPNPPERIECEKDLKRELKELKQKFAEYDGHRVYSPKVFFLL